MNALKNENIIDDMLDVFIETKDVNGDDVKALLKESLKGQVVNEVWNLKRDEIIKDSEEKYRQIKEERKKSQIKVVLIETLILGCLVGLLVNQGTDILTILKQGTDYNLLITLGFILILLALSAFMVFCMYLEKLDEFFIKD